MILRPEANSEYASSRFIPAWEAIERAQRKEAARALVGQPDHARLSGQIVEHFAIAGAPPPTDDIVRGISLHDEGWAVFDSGAEKLQATPAHYSGDNVALNAQGKPLSFLDIKAGDFLRAWRGSIESAECVAPIAGLIVSGHFNRLGHFGLHAGRYQGDDAQRVQEFVDEEERRKESLLRIERREVAEIEYWTDVLQFCDLLSLYLCCGSKESVEFPQRIGPEGEAIRLTVQDGVNVVSPAIFAREQEFSLEAHGFPGEEWIHLRWRLR